MAADDSDWVPPARIASVEYSASAAQVLVRLTRTSSDLVTVLLFIDDIWFAEADTYSDTAALPLADPQPAFVYRVAIRNPDGTNQPGVEVVFQTPQLEGARFTSAETVTVAWSLSTPNRIEHVDAKLVDADEVVVDVARGYGTGARLEAPVPLSGAYTVKMRAARGVAVGPEITLPEPIGTDAPTIESAIFDVRGAPGVLVTATTAPPPGAMLEAVLWSGGRRLAGTTGGGRTVLLLVNRPLDPELDWYVTLAYARDRVWHTSQMVRLVGPPSAPAGVAVRPPPGIATVDYSAAADTITVTLDRQPLLPVSVDLFKGWPRAPSIASGTSSSTTVELAAPEFEAGELYSVAVRLETESWGPAVELVLDVPSLAWTAAYDDDRQTYVQAAWTAPEGNNFEYVEASLRDGEASAIAASGRFYDTGAFLAAPTPLDGEFVVTARGVRGAARGPLAELAGTLIATTPQILELGIVSILGAASFAVAVRAGAPAPGSLDLVGRLLRDGERVESAVASPGTDLVRLPCGQGLDPGAHWEVELLHRGGQHDYGPPVTQTVPVAQPELTMARFVVPGQGEGGNPYLHVEWSYPAGGGAATGAAAKLESGDRTQLGIARVFSGSKADVYMDAPWPIDPDERYAVRLAPLLGETAQGQFGERLRLIVAPPAIAGVSVADGQAIVRLTPTLPQRQCELVVSADGRTLRTQPGGTDGGYVELPEGITARLAIAARAVDGPVLGPLSEPLPLITVVPSLHGIEASDHAVTGSVKLPPGFADAGAEIALYAGGVLIGLTAADEQGRFSITKETDAALTLRAAITEYVGFVPVRGPLSPPVSVLTVAPVITHATLSSSGFGQWRLEAEWELPEAEDVALFRVELVQDGTVVRKLPAQGFSIDVPVTGFEVSRSLALRVTATTGFATSPASPAVTFWPGDIPVGSSVVTGNRVSATWAPLSGVSHTAFRLRLLENVDNAWVPVAESAPTSATTASLPIPHLVPGVTSFALVVDVAIGPAWSSAGHRTLVSTESPVVKSVECEPGGDSFRIAWEWPGGVPDDVEEYAFFELLDGMEMPLPAQASRSWALVRLKRPATPARRYAMRALVGYSSGPLTPPLPLVTAAPAPWTVTAEADALRVTFGGAGLAATAHRVTLLTGGSEVAYTTVRESPAILRHPPAVPDASYSVTIRGLAAEGLSAGPQSHPLAVVLVPPVLTAAAADDDTLRVDVTPPRAGGVAVTAYRVELLREGVPCALFEELTPDQGVLTVPVGPASDPADRHTVRVAAVVQRHVTGPAASLDVVLAAPAVTAARVHGQDGDLHVDVLVDRGGLPADLLLQVVGIADGEPGSPITAIDGAATVPIPAEAKLFAVAARAGTPSATGPWSPALAVPIARPEVSARVGGGTVDLTWSGEPDGAYFAAVRSADATDVAAEVVHGLSVSLPLIDPAALGYEAYVERRAGAATGPAGRLSLVTKGCRVTAAAAVEDELNLTWDAVPGASGYQPVALAAGGELPLSPVGGGQTSATIALSALPGAAELAVRALAGRARGPLGDAAAVIRAAPRDLRLAYDGGTLSATWDALPDARVTAYDVELEVSGQQAVTARVAKPSYSVALAPPPGATATLSVAAAAGVASGPACDPVAALLAPAPKIESAAVAGSMLALEWTPVEDAPGYEVAVLAGGAAVRRVRTTAASAKVELPPGPVTVEVRAAGERSLGAASHPFTPIVDAPVITSAGFGAIDAELTVDWSAAAGAEAYTLEIRAGSGGPAYTKWTTGTSATVAASALPPGELEARVQPGAPDSTGPWSAPVTVLNVEPVGLRVDWNGRGIRARWDPVPAAVAGYEVTLVDGTTPVGTPQRVTAPSIEMAVAYDGAKTFGLVVQAVGGDGAGRPTATVPLLEPALYAQVTDTLPRLFRATEPPLAAQEIVAYLPEIGPFKAGSLPIPHTAGGPLELAANEDAATSAAYPYTLTIAGDALVFQDPNARIRGPLQTAYVDLLKKVEDAASSPNPWGIWVLQQAVSRFMPQTFAETLYYAYGMSPSGSSADLRPGMVLRVASSDFQLMPSRAAPAWSTGYAAGASLDYEIADYDDPTDGWRVGFDSLVAWLVSNSIVDVPQPETGLPPAEGYAESGAADSADLFFPAFRRPFFRLLFPRNLQPTTPPASGRTAQQFAIAAAGRFQDLLGAGREPVGGVALAYFRGRSVAKPCIRVEVDGCDEVVPVGTTVGNVLDRLGRRPPSTKIAVDGIVLERASGPAVLDPRAGYGRGHGTRVRLDWPFPSQPVPPRDALMLPLLHGDRLTVGGAR